jgi:tripartite-type tricarboxylate transporter receptor subunit TctC
VTWFGVLTRAGTPPAILRKLNADIVRIVHDDGAKAKLNAAGLDDIVGDSVEHFSAFLLREVPRWHQLARDMNLKGQRGS